MMESLLRFTILVILGGVTSQNYDVNSQISYKGETKQKSVEATTLIPPDPKIDNIGIQLLLTRLETLCTENLGYLIAETNRRFESLENRSSEVHSTVRKIVQNNDNLETKVENLGKDIQVLKDASRNLPSDVESIKRNISSLINVTRSVVDSSSNLVSLQIFNKALQELKNLQATPAISCPINSTVNKQYPKHCAEVQKSGEKASGIYTIHPDRAPKPFEVVCDLETRGGNWTVIQRRFDDSQSFDLGWEEYKNGFGNLRGEFWLGLEKIHILTGFQVNELLIDQGLVNPYNKTALHSHFSVGSETEGYSLNILADNSQDPDYAWNVGSIFVTKDMVQDNDSTTCADNFKGAWWDKDCRQYNVNGEERIESGDAEEIEEFDSPVSRNTSMLVRPKI